MTPLGPWACALVLAFSLPVAAAAGAVLHPDLARQLSAARERLVERLAALEAPQTPAASQLSALEQELERWWSLQTEADPTPEQERLVRGIRVALAQARAAGPNPSQQLLERVRADLALLVRPAAQGGGARAGGATRTGEPPAAERERREGSRAATTAGMRAGARARECAGAFDGARCGGAALVAPVVRLTNANGPVTVGAGANPRLDESGVPPPSGAAALRAGVMDAIREQLLTVGGWAMNLVGVLLGFLASLATAGVARLLKVLAVIAMSAGIALLLAQVVRAIAGIARTRPGTPERNRHMRSLGYAGGTILIMVGAALIGWQLGKTAIGAAAAGRLRGAITRLVSQPDAPTPAPAPANPAPTTQPALAPPSPPPVAMVPVIRRMGRYQVLELNESYVTETDPVESIFGRAVRYLRTPAERAPYRLTMRNGRLYDAQGKLFDTRAGVTQAGGRGRAIIVMDSDGTIYAALQHATGDFHHSSFNAGRPVAFAGEVEVVDGVIMLVSNKSGHYLTPRRFIRQLLERMREGGIDTRRVRWEEYIPEWARNRPPGSTTIMPDQW